MIDVLQAYPSAQRALFRRYHIGGCNSCGYQPEDVLEDVARKHGIADADEIVAFLKDADETDRRIQTTVAEVAAALRGPNPPKLLDVRSPDEWQIARLPGAQLVDERLAQEVMTWAPSTPIVLYCHSGQRSLDAASYLAGHGFVNVRSMAGGIDAWSAEIDSTVPRYEVARDPYSGRPTLRPLRAAMG
ncbi:MAG: rhodanese-like domain-containing protein [Planctomycetes bacterium]|nr:rhodanese-like domain-containing protein [Planctomycetota bacterium]